MSEEDAIEDGLPPESVVGYGTPYDYGSMMHYQMTCVGTQLRR
jgi:hypothetical protein